VLSLSLHFLYRDAKDVYAGAIMECGTLEEVLVKFLVVAVASALLISCPCPDIAMRANRKVMIFFLFIFHKFYLQR